MTVTKLKGNKVFCLSVKKEDSKHKVQTKSQT